jgi:hypothetical protein
VRAQWDSGRPHGTRQLRAQLRSQGGESSHRADLRRYGASERAGVEAPGVHGWQREKEAAGRGSTVSTRARIAAVSATELLVVACGRHDPRASKACAHRVVQVDGALTHARYAEFCSSMAPREVTSRGSKGHMISMDRHTKETVGSIWVWPFFGTRREGRGLLENGPYQTMAATLASIGRARCSQLVSRPRAARRPALVVRRHAARVEGVAVLLDGWAERGSGLDGYTSRFSVDVVGPGAEFAAYARPARASVTK